MLAGRPFYQLQKYGMQTALVKEIIRQKDQELLAAVDFAIKQQISEAIAKLGNRLYQVKNKDERIAALAELFLSYSQKERMRTKVGTGSREDREKVNLLIRSGLRSEGIVKGEDLTTNILFPADLTTIEKCTADYYITDNLVRFNKTYSSLGVTKGEYLKVSATDQKNNLGGSSGSPLCKQDNHKVIGVHVQGGTNENIALDIDKIAKVSGCVKKNGNPK